MSKMMNIKTKNKIFNGTWSLFRMTILCGLAFIILYPLIYMVSMSIRPLDQISDPTVVWIPKSFTMDNIKLALSLMQFPDSIINTFLIMVVSSIISVVVCSFVGYGFARFKFPLKNVLFFCVILTILVPTQCLLIPMTTNMRYFDFLFLGQFGKLFGGEAVTVNLLNTPFAMYVPALFASGIRSGLFIFIYRQFYMGLPAELEDAAYIDGCGPLKTFIKVMLPLASGAIIIVLLLSFVSYWNDEFYTTFFYDNLTTLNSALKGLGAAVKDVRLPVNVSNASIAYLQSGAMLYMAFPMIIFIIFQRFFTESIERTGIVG